MQAVPLMSPHRSEPRPIKEIVLRVTLSAEQDTLRMVADLDNKFTLKGKQIERMIREEDPLAVISQAKEAVESIKKATERSKDLK
ncbi:MAG: hypothetical protein OK422_03630 [Thaumarchaeota archaeon]|nr:hypothetical protein [Nitrososphaerota archaeon]